MLRVERAAIFYERLSKSRDTIGVRRYPCGLLLVRMRA